MNAKPAQAPVRAYDPTSPLAKLLRQCRRAFVFVFLITLVSEVLSLAPILFMLNVFDRVLSSRSQTTLVSLTALVIGVYVLWSALEWVRSRLLVRISLRIDWDLAARTFDASFRRFIGHKKVNVHQVLGDLLQLRQFLTASSLIAVMSAPFAIVFIIIGGIFHPYLAVFALVASVVLLVTSYLTQKASTPALRAANEAQAESNRLAAENLRLAETAHALGMQADIRRRWYESHQDYLQLQVNASEAAGVMGGISGFLAKALPSMQMALACWLAIEGLITGGMVIAASLLISKAIGPMQKLLGSWKEIASTRQAYDRLDLLLLEDDAQADRMELPAPKGRLVVANLAGVPPGSNKAVVQGLRFTAEPGQITTVIGQSAAGKTSLMRLLVGIWRPAAGSVRLDGAEISDWSHDEVGRYIGYVPQEIDFFEGTIAENVARLGTVDSEKVVRATKLAGMHDIILAMPQGYETPLGPTGHGLTGGQRQRLAIARAFYGEPPYIVMDEPNANLDEASERALIAALKELKSRGANVILTTHRPSLMEVADQVLILAEGRQAGFGPMAEMIAAARKANTGAALQPVAPAKEAPKAVAPAAAAPTPRAQSPAAPAPAASANAKPLAAPQGNPPAALNGKLRHLRLETLHVQGANHLLNTVDNVGPCLFDPASNAIQLKFQLVSLFKNGAIAGFCLTDEATGKSIVLNPKRAESPSVVMQHAELDWAHASRFVFDEVLGLGAPPQKLAVLAVPKFDEGWYLAKYADVADAIRQGKFKSAREHYLRHGHAEGRDAGEGAGKPQRIALVHVVPAEAGQAK
ncbi:MAG: type I secretion system permease/ATPase [Proteobacteria bacterium]|nr:type I secretion system permease/ATPase [Pseudomonadota bacterium]